MKVAFSATLLLLLLLLFCLFGCADKPKKLAEQIPVDSISNQSEVKLNNNSNFPTIENAQIIRFDSISSRYFLVIDSNFVYDYEMINTIVCELENKLDVEPFFIFSFFCSPMWADYKTEIFIDERSSFTEKEYPKWRNNYYLGEFDFESRKYSAYPFSNSSSIKKKDLTLRNCI